MRTFVIGDLHDSLRKIIDLEALNNNNTYSYEIWDDNELSDLDDNKLTRDHEDFEYRGYDDEAIMTRWQCIT